MTQWGLDTLFNPAKRHMDEEKRRLQSTREEVGDSSGGKRIDLESGRVTIRKPDADDADETDAEPPAADEPAEADQDGAKAEVKPGKAKPDKAKAPDATSGNAKSPGAKSGNAKSGSDKPAAAPKAKREMTPAAKRAAERRARLRG